MKKVIIIGGGLGGLSAAITLANKGFQVQLFEKNEHFGGKLKAVQLGDYHFDFGPNTITMPSVFLQVIEQTGEKSSDYLSFVRLQEHTQNVFPDGSRFTFSSDPVFMLKQLDDVDPFGAKRYPDFLKEISRLHELSQQYFLPRTFQSWTDYLSPSLGSALLRVRPFETLDHFFRSYFHNPNIINAYNRYATYIGSSPYSTPATFAMIAYLEMLEGVYYVDGGNVKIAEAFTALARKLGVTLRNNSLVKKILVQNKKAVGVELEDGERFDADYVIMNADLLQAYPKLVSEEWRPSFTQSKVDRLEPSISAFVILVGLNKRLPNLKHHNVYFSNDYQLEFDNLFESQAYAESPTIYICNSSYTDKEQSPNGDNLFLLVNAPALPKSNELQVEPEEYKKMIYDRLATFGVSLTEDVIVEEKVITPANIAAEFGAFRGALYGLSSNHKKDAFLRPRNRSKDIDNLYFVGGSTHPGGGSPMVTMSGRNVAQLIVSREGF